MGWKTNYILFTGAGFTDNFGGFLASEMWAHIFNKKVIQSNEIVRNLMLRADLDFDYETTYRIIMDSDDYNPKEKDAIRFAVEMTYTTLDSNIVERYESLGSNVQTLNSFINLFSKRQRVGFFFTINQDMFIERFHRNGLYKCPGVRFTVARHLGRAPLRDLGYGELPSQKEIEENKKDYFSKNFFYIKLHGSQNWMAGNAMVIGGRKKEQIEKVPILKLYFEIFEKVLYQPNKKILIIGYGFKDEHINQIIMKAMKAYGLKIYIISPQKPKEFLDSLILADSLNAFDIWDGLAGYYPYYLKDLFPVGEQPTNFYKEIIDQFFDM